MKTLACGEARCLPAAAASVFLKHKRSGSAPLCWPFTRNFRSTMPAVSRTAGCWRVPESSGCMFPSHHVLPQHLAGHRVVRFLADRFNIDAISNRMALPPKQSIAANLSSSPHTGGHLGTYYKGFCEYLKTVGESTRYDAALAGDTRARDELVSDVNGFVAAAKYALANGHLFANTPTGLTPEEAHERNRKWFDNWRKYAADNQPQIDQMREVVDQLSNAGQPNAALHWPILSPTSDLSMEERIAVAKQHMKVMPISLQSTAVGPVPGLPGLITSPVDTRLRGFSSPDHSDLNENEGLTQSDPRFSRGIPAFPTPSEDERRLGQLPPSTAMPPEPQILQFHPETSDLLRFSDGSPLLGPNPHKMPFDPNDGPAALRGMAIFAAAMAAPALLPLLPALLPIAALGLVGATAARAEPTGNARDGVSAPETSPHRPFDPIHDASKLDHPFGARPSAAEVPNSSFDQGPMQAGTFADRFGSWGDAPAGTPVQNGQEVSVSPAAETAPPEEVRRLTRVNTSNAGNVFASGSAPVPYLPSQEFNDRFGNWHMPTGESQPQRASRPINPLADEPSYFIPPPIFGSDDVGNPRNDAEEWFSRWIRPFLGPE